MRVAVLGASGFVGSAVAADLQLQGMEVVRVSRFLNAESAHADLGDSAAVWAKALAGADVVVNSAGKAHDVGWADAEQSATYWAVNAAVASRAAEVAAAVGAARFIHLSTIKVLGSSPYDGLRFRESDPLDPHGVYAESKAAGERLVLEVLDGTGTEGVVVRLPLVFGAPFKGNLAILERAIRKGLPLPLSDPSIGKRTYVQMPDLLGIIRTLVTGSGLPPPILHACSRPDLSAAEVAQMVGKTIGRAPRLFPVRAALIRRAARLIGQPEYAAKICDEMLVSDEFTRAALKALEG